jgi:hypothetical protein
LRRSRRSSPRRGRLALTRRGGWPPSVSPPLRLDAIGKPSKRHADKPLGHTGCSTVAGHGVRRRPGICLIFYVLPANQHFLRADELRADERTRTAHLLQLRVTHQALQGFASAAYLEGFPFHALLSVAPYCVRGSIRVVSGGDGLRVVGSSSNHIRDQDTRSRDPDLSPAARCSRSRFPARSSGS